MLSSQLALHGLQPIEYGNPFITSFISQENVIEEFSLIPRFKKIWDRAMQIANRLVPDNHQGVVHVQLVYACFISSTVKIIDDDFDWSIVNSHTILHSKLSINSKNDTETSASLIKANVNIVLFN